MGCSAVLGQGNSHRTILIVCKALGLEEVDVTMDDHHACGAVVVEEEDSPRKIRFASKDDLLALSLDGNDAWDAVVVERRFDRGVVPTAANPRP